MSTRVYVSGDSGAISVGADGVAGAIAAHCALSGLDVTVIRNGSRGAYWLEPLVEIDTPEGRIGFANVQASQVPALFASRLPEAGHPACLGLVDALPWFAAQRRLTFRRAGLTDPLSLDDYRRHGGLEGLERALTLAPEAIVAEVTASGLRGRGGAAFPAGIKWNTVRTTPSARARP